MKAVGTLLNAMMLERPRYPAILAPGHDLQQFVLHQPGGLVANTQMTFQLQRRGIVLGLGQQVHGKKPAGEWQFGRLEDRAGGDRTLVPAEMALPVGPTLTQKSTMSRVATTRATKARRPARRLKRGQTFVFAAVSLKKLSHRKSVLKLNLVHRCHGVLPCGRYAQFTPRQAHRVSLAEEYHPLTGRRNRLTNHLFSLTVDMTVDGDMSEQKARFYAGSRPSEIIEWE